MKRTLWKLLNFSVTLVLVTLALIAIPVAGTELNTLATADTEDIDLGVGDDSRWNTKVLVYNVSEDYPQACYGSRVFDAATGPGDVFYLVYYDINRNALLLVRVDKEKVTAEKVVSSARFCGVSVDVNPVNGAPAVSYRAKNSTPFVAYKKDGVWTPEIVDTNITEGYSTSLAFDRTGTPHIAYDDGTSFSNLMYGKRNPDGIWTTEIADRGIGGRLGDAGKNPKLRVTDTGTYIAHGDGFIYESLRFSYKPSGKDWTSVTVDRGWGETGASSITGLTGLFPTFAMGPDGIATIIYEDAINQTLMKARGPLANNSFKTSVLMNAEGRELDGWYPVLVNKGSAGSGFTSGHLVFISPRTSTLWYAEINADSTLLPRVEKIDYHISTSTVTSDSAGKPHVFYLDPLSGRIKYAWLK